MVTPKVLLQAYPHWLGAFHIPASKLCNSETKVFISALHFCISPTSGSVIAGRDLGEHAAPLVLQAEKGQASARVTHCQCCCKLLDSFFDLLSSAPQNRG